MSAEPQESVEGRESHDQRAPRVMPDVHLRDYIAIILQHIKLVVIVLLGVVAMGMVKVWSAKPLYQASALVRVGGGEGPSEFARDYSGEKELSTYCRIITGQDFAGRVVQELGVRSYKDLNTAKFKLIHEIEAKLPMAPYDAEWEAVGRGKAPELYLPFTHVEICVPWVFLVLHAVVVLQYIL